MNKMNLGNLFSKVYSNQLKLIGKKSARYNCSTYLVGGPVRDLLLEYNRKTAPDLDIAIEIPDSSGTSPSGGGKNKFLLMKRFVKSLAKTWSNRKPKIKFHPEFLTGTLSFNDGSHIDFSLTRKETYIYPGALPKVKPASLKKDLERRDFTINAMAVCLNPDRFGVLIDPHNGLNDLKKGHLKILHKRSFIDDPTRILRAIRFLFKFKIKPDRTTNKLMKESIKKNHISLVSHERIREELLAILNEEKSGSCLKFLCENGMLRHLAGINKLSSEKYKLIDHRFANKNPVLIKLSILLYGLKPKEVKLILQNIKLSRKLNNEICDLFLFLSGKVIKKLPDWTKYFFQIMNISPWKPKVVTGKDLIKFGFKPGPIFSEILESVRKNQRIKTRKDARKFIMKKYACRTNNS